MDKKQVITLKQLITRYQPQQEQATRLKVGMKIAILAELKLLK